jgi:hypothetical protein
MLEFDTEMLDNEQNDQVKWMFNKLVFSRATDDWELVIEKSFTNIRLIWRSNERNQ